MLKKRKQLFFEHNCAGVGLSFAQCGSYCIVHFLSLSRIASSTYGYKSRAIFILVGLQKLFFNVTKGYQFTVQHEGQWNKGTFMNKDQRL